MPRAGISSKSTLLEIARQFDDAAMHEFLDGLIAGKIKPKSKKAKAESETAAAGVKRSEVPDTLQNELQFRSASGKYEVVIRFREKGPASRVEILKLLKEAFESVKNDGALIQ